MEPSKHIEPTGRMVNNHCHWEFQYDPPSPGQKSTAPGFNVESYQAVELRRRKDG